jgi:multidrug efflux pump subunit AcrA (membrane-fusion protein)
MPLATLAEREKAESELTHLQHRQEHYEKQLGIDPKAQKKLAEKKKLIADLQAKVTQMQLLAPQAGAVVTVEAKPGDKVAPGQPVLHLADPMLHTVFNVPVFDAGSMGDGASVRLKAENGRLIPAHVARVQGEVVNVDVDANTGLKDGEPVRLVKAWLSGMVKLPASTVVQRGGVNTVFVLADGEAKARPVVVYDREGDEVRIMKGLNAGEQAIVDPPPLIQDGDKAVLAR